MSTKETGFLGEKIAQKYLENKGYKILDKNYCFRLLNSPQKGEIDIIAKKNDIISFVEVKTLKQNQNRSFFPEDRVNFSKRKKIIRTAESWLTKNKTALDVRWQIDIISISIDLNSEKAKIQHFQNITF